jgi:hypothetical protein
MPRPVLRWMLALGRPLAAATYCTLALCCSACGPARKPVYPVQGEVRVNGRAPVHAQVGFFPVKDAGPDVVHPIGQVDDQGRFTLTSYAKGDGAPEGEYRVTVAWFLASGRLDDVAPPVNYLPSTYAQPDSTPLRAVVAKGGVQLQPFDLKVK